MAAPKRCRDCGEPVKLPAVSVKQRGGRTFYYCDKCAAGIFGSDAMEEFRESCERSQKGKKNE